MEENSAIILVSIMFLLIGVWVGSINKEINTKNQVCTLISSTSIQYQTCIQEKLSDLIIENIKRKN